MRSLFQRCAMLSVQLMLSTTSGTAQLSNFEPRALALGGANIAEPTGTRSLYGNPAAMVFSRQQAVIVTHMQGPEAGELTEQVAIPLVGSTNQSLAFGTQVSHRGYFHPGLETQARSLRYGFDVGLASAIATTLSVGGTVNLRYGRTENSSAQAISGSIGLLYSPAPEISYALAYRGMGSGIQTVVRKSSLKAIRENLPRSLEIGAAMRFPSSSSLRHPILVLALGNEKILRAGGLLYKGGVELYPFDFLALRMGYVVGPTVSEPKYGLALHVGSVHFEYVYDKRTASAVSHGFSFLADL